MTLCLLCGLLVVVPTRALAADGDVAVSEENFPDATFRDYVSRNCDTNGDGFLSEAEIAAVTSIDVSYSGIQDLQGIRNFTSLQSLNCNGSWTYDIHGQLTSLDVSGLASLASLSCSNNQLAMLVLGDLPSLKTLEC